MTAPNDIFADFPYLITRKPDGNYFDSWKEAKDAGYDDDQIWSVIEGEDDDGSLWFTYGPPHHYVNHIGHVVTKERHDHNTYYHELISEARPVRKKLCQKNRIRPARLRSKTKA